MPTPTERRLGLLDQLFPPLAKPSSDAAKQDAWLRSLTVPTLIFINRGWRALELANADDVAAVHELMCEAERRNQLDRDGLLVRGWESEDLPLEDLMKAKYPDGELPLYSSVSSPARRRATTPPEPEVEPAPDLEPRAPARAAPAEPTFTAPICLPPDVPRVIDFRRRRRK